MTGEGDHPGSTGSGEEDGLARVCLRHAEKCRVKRTMV